MYILILLVSFNAFSLSLLPKKEEKKVYDKVSVKKSAPKRNNYLRFLEAENKSLKKIANMRLSRPDIWEDNALFRTGDMISGKTFLSILSTNLDSPIVIIPSSNPNIPDGSKVLCKGRTKHKRVMVSCNKLVTPQYTVDIDAVLLESDGTFGLSGQYYSGKEEFIAGVLATEFTKGVLSTQQDRLDTVIGTVTKNNTRNQLLNGLITSSSAATDMMREEMQSKEPKVFISRNKKVILFFNSEVTRNENI